MPNVPVGLSVAEKEKITAYKKAIDDRKKRVVKVAERVPADAGMAGADKMPSGAMEPDQPMESLLAGLAPGVMPTPAMNAGARGTSGAAGNEMPRPPMN